MIWNCRNIWTESVNLIDSGDWFSTMMPKLKEGQRSYYLERDAQPLFYAQGWIYRQRDSVFPKCGIPEVRQNAS